MDLGQGLRAGHALFTTGFACAQCGAAREETEGSTGEGGSQPLQRGGRGYYGPAPFWQRPQTGKLDLCTTTRSALPGQSQVSRLAPLFPKALAARKTTLSECLRIDADSGDPSNHICSPILHPAAPRDRQAPQPPLTLQLRICDGLEQPPSC